MPIARPVESASQDYSLARLVLYFLKLGTIGFGGPIALAGYMQKDLVEDRHWISQQEYVDGLAFSQLHPGPLAAQLAMYLGYVRSGILGATLIGMVFILPSFVMVAAIGRAYVALGGTRVIAGLFYGIGAAVIAIIARSAVKLFKSTVRRDKLLWAVFLALAVSTAVTEKEIVWLFLAGGFLIVIARTDFRSWTQRPQRPAILCLLTSGLQFGTSGTLFAFFLKASLFVFGSGLAIVPFLHGGVVQEHHWLTEAQFLDAVAVAMITPGPVVITVAFIGYLVSGMWGACIAAVGVFLPVYLFVIVVGPFFRRFSHNLGLRAFVEGVTAAATGAIAGAVVVLARRAIYDWVTAAIALITAALLFRWKIPEPFMILAAAFVGLVAHH
ncbi:MAG TPA: chromate efflux transporter [Terriglobales bacterium]|nr:chromate efflux transporter [Terriglobales bacterium]